ncbi:MAG: HesA/MoeB/ThiF family protein [Sphingobacteriaceae bacterium]|nr:HesA/MoeB/ThiF family protein [Sphingobacteriaceae bacterium]
MLSNNEKRKYIKQIMLSEIGVSGQEKIKEAKVAIVGCGGLGCPTLLYLCAAGVGTIGIIDFDTVHITNLHRQILFGQKDVNLKKVDVAKTKLNLMHPEINIIAHDVLINDENAAELLKDYDLIIDGCDNFETRYTVNDACVKLNKPLVYGSILGFEGQLSVFNYRGSKDLRAIFPVPPAKEDVPDCSENGVLATVPGVMGTLLANEALKLILNLNPLMNQYIILDLKKMNLNCLHF